MNWDLFDFAMAAVLIGALIALSFLVFRLVKRPLYRAISVLVVVAAVTLVWAELAVGIFH